MKAVSYDETARAKPDVIAGYFGFKKVASKRNNNSRKPFRNIAQKAPFSNSKLSNHPGSSFGLIFKGIHKTKQKWAGTKTIFN